MNALSVDAVSLTDLADGSVVTLHTANGEKIMLVITNEKTYMGGDYPKVFSLLVLRDNQLIPGSDEYRFPKLISDNMEYKILDRSGQPVMQFRTCGIFRTRQPSDF